MRPVAILDFGSQYTQLIARRIREQHVFCEILSHDTSAAALQALDPIAIILSGGPSSVFEEGAPTIDPAILSLGRPVLGICYGMQLMAQLLGGEVQPAQEREYGAATLRVTRAAGLFQTLREGDALDVWMSHGDRVASLPPGFEVFASTQNCPMAAVGNVEKGMFALQFHPEVAHTRQGVLLLRTFLFEVAKARPEWTAEAFVETSVAAIAAQVGEGTAICGLSGGVDSSVAATLVQRAIGDRLTCLFVDNGLLRLGEAERVMAMFAAHLSLRVIHIDARQEFLTALAGVIDPEEKRKRIGAIFIEVFEREAAKIVDADFLVQGTLYPDVIESVSHKGPSQVIKSHHNVGGLPAQMKLKLVEPLRLLFKDEVREVGEAMGIPREVLWRHPFPGPGLAIRCPGEVTEEKLDVLRRADAILEEEIREAGLYDALWQCFCVILPVKTVGVMGDQRTYEWVVAIRAVESEDGMTADWAKLPYALLAKISSRIINDVRGCNRVCLDISSKPPATIEWE